MYSSDPDLIIISHGNPETWQYGRDLYESGQGPLRALVDAVMKQRVPWSDGIGSQEGFISMELLIMRMYVDFRYSCSRCSVGKKDKSISSA
jgi:hypothetical protein